MKTKYKMKEQAHYKGGKHKGKHKGCGCNCGKGRK
jgi:hypothetical protein